MFCSTKQFHYFVNLNGSVALPRWNHRARSSPSHRERRSSVCLMPVPNVVPVIFPVHPNWINIRCCESGSTPLPLLEKPNFTNKFVWLSDHTEALAPRNQRHTHVDLWIIKPNVLNTFSLKWSPEQWAIWECACPTNGKFTEPSVKWWTVLNDTSTTLARSWTAEFSSHNVTMHLEVQKVLFELCGSVCTLVHLRSLPEKLMHVLESQARHVVRGNLCFQQDIWNK